MIAYSYDNDGVYTGPVNCQIDPVRSKREGKDVYLLPAGSVLEMPPEFDPETQKAVWDGAVWKIEDVPQPEPEPDHTPEPVNELEQLRTEVAALQAGAAPIMAAAQVYALTAVNIPDTQALSMATLFPAWAEVLSNGAELARGRVINKDGRLYRVVQAVTPQAHQEPGGEGMLAVYRPIDREHAGTLEDPIPWVYGMDCMAGMYYSYNGAVYRVADGGDMIPCVWAPDTPGLWQWERIKEAE